MKTAVITVVRNEMDVLPAWMPHIRALVDYVYVADHQSTDGTFEYLQDWKGGDPAVHLYSYADSFYDRERVIKTLRRLVLEETETDWLFILDPDEFLPYESREQFHAPLRVAEEPVVEYLWRNALPTEPGPLVSPIESHRQVRSSKLGKVAINRTVAADPMVKIPRGAHFVTHQHAGRLPTEVVGDLYHFPFRSLEQAWTKVLVGTLNRLRILNADPNANDNWHYLPLLDLMVNEPTWNSVKHLVFDYGQPMRRSIETDSFLDPVASHFEPHVLTFAGKTSAHPGSRSKKTSTLPAHVLRRDPDFRTLLEELMSLSESTGQVLSDELAVTGDDHLLHPADFSGRRFPTLKNQPASAVGMPDVTRALQAAGWEIPHAPASSCWGAHVPFLFSLLSLIRPRVYVDLGMQDGASLLGASVAVQRTGQDAICVGVDNGMGDLHSGMTPDGEFESVRNTLAERFPGIAGYIRADLSEARKQFEPGSIDVLHINGVHTEDAVRDEFRAWADRLSDRGVVLIHDINEFKPNFGVWKFWRRIREGYPYLEFGHGHGLGVLVVGEMSPLRRPIEGTDVSLLSEQSAELLQMLFGGIGPMSWSQARDAIERREAQRDLRRAQASVENLQKNLADVRAKLKKVRRRAKRLESRIHDFETSTSWRITGPVRVVARRLQQR